MNLWRCIYLICVLVSVVCASNILLIENVASRSHHLWHRPLVTTLLNRGHRVILLSVYPAAPAHNLTNYVMEGTLEKISKNYNFLQMSTMSALESIMRMYQRVQDQCEAELSSNGFQQFLMDSHEMNIDLVLVDLGSVAGPCFYPIIKQLGGPPVIATSPFLVPAISVFMTGGPACPSICPHFALPYADEMSFAQRLYNTVFTGWYLYYYRYQLVPKLESIAKKHYTFNFSSTLEVEKNVSFILANDDPIIGWPQPALPTIVPVSGLHIQASNSLPQDINQFLDEAKDGVILFTLGSNMQSTRMAPDKVQAFVNGFSKIPQRVLWKWESNPPENLSSNVMVREWLPQNEILGHKNTRAFIMHAGILGVQEAIFNGVPIIGIPFFFDQKFNLNKIITKGFGVGLNYHTLSAEDIIDAINEVLYNSTYAKNVKKASAQFRDQLQTPLERAIFAIEYAIRHKGTQHMRSASVHMSFFQTHSIDVFIALFVLVGIALASIFVLSYLLFRMMLSKTNHKLKIS